MQRSSKVCGFFVMALRSTEAFRSMAVSQEQDSGFVAYGESDY
jgi:hypothetical protein